MIRKLAFVLVVVAFASLLVFFYFKFQEKKTPNQDYFQAVPFQSVWVMDIKKPSELFRTMSQTNIIYQDLIDANLLGSLHQDAQLLDSIVSNNAETFLALSNTSIVLSLSPSGANNYDYLFSIKLPNSLNEEIVITLLGSNFFQAIPDTGRAYDGAEIITLVSNNGQSRYYASNHKGYTIFSPSPMLVEDAIRQLNSDVSIKSNPEFNRVYQTAGDKRALNFFVNSGRLQEFFKTRIDKNHAGGFDNLKDFSGWTALDFLIKPNNLLLNGFSYSNDSTTNFLGVFQGQKEGSPEALSILPSNASFFVHYSISDFQGYRKKYLDYLSAKNQLHKYHKKMKTFTGDSVLDPESLFRDLCGSEVMFSVLEIPSDVSNETISSIGDKSLAIIRMRDREKGTELLTSLMKKEKDEVLTSTYRDIDIFELDADGLLSSYFGELFYPLQNKYCANINGYAVFADKKGTLRDVINSYHGEKTLDKDIHFQTFSNNLSSSANMMVYSNVARSPYLLSYFLNKENRDKIEGLLPLFRKFDGLAMQITCDENNRYYHNIFVNHNPIYKQITSSLWEIPLDTAPAINAQLFTNHYTKTQEIFIQDLKHKAYLISNTGRVLWTKQLDGKILGKIHEVDRFKNKKYQILFNTSNKIFLLDRNGKDVSGFPVKMKIASRFPLSVIDYDNNRKYRLFVADTLGGVSCYNIEGGIVKGWNYKGKSELVQGIIHIQINRKDYLISCRQDGKVILLNRKGQQREKIDEKLFIGKNGQLVIEKGKDLTSTNLYSLDTLGNIVKLSLSGRIELIQLQGSGPSAFLQFTDVNLDGKRDFVIQNNQRIYIYDQEKNPLLTFNSKDSLQDKPVWYKVNEDEMMLSLNSLVSSRVQLISTEGMKYDGSPFFGGYKSAIADINLDGRVELVTISPQGMVYCYVLN